MTYDTVEIDEIVTADLGRVHVAARLYSYTDDKRVSHMQLERRWYDLPDSRPT